MIAFPRAAVARGVGWLLGRLDPHVHLSYSQDGEDMVLRRFFGAQENGFYVDVGAHHPFRFSNTCYFHRFGWHGINIDADPDAIAAFARHRPTDTNLCLGVGSQPGHLTFYRFNEPALNTFDAELAASRTQGGSYRVIESREVPVRSLADILANNLPSGQQIDFMSIDVEGMDADVLSSNDWSRFRPRFLLVEALRVRFADLNDDAVVRIAKSHGYEIGAKTANTVIFRNVDDRAIE